MFNNNKLLRDYKLCIMLVGLPASGKSTIRNKILNEFIPNNNNFVVISRDDILEKHIANLGITYRESFGDQEFQDKINMEFDQLKTNSIGHNVIIDLTNLSKKIRENNLQPYKTSDTNYLYVAIVCKSSMKELLERNNAREETGRNIPIDVIMSMIERYEDPVISEGFDIILDAIRFLTNF